MSLSLYQRALQWLLMRVRPNVLAAKLKPLLGVKRQAVQTAQGLFWIDPVSLLGVALSQRGLHEEGMIRTLETYLQNGSTFVDLGANEGYFTVIAARLCGESGRVLSIEPQTRLVPVIQENVQLNRSPNVTLVNFAIGDTPGKAVIHLTASTNTGASGFGRMTKYHLPTQEVAVLTLQQVLDQAGFDHVDLMKVDIEGFEYEALLGSPEVFAQRRIRMLALELHPEVLASRGKAVRDIEAMLETSGYTCHETFGNAVWTAASQSDFKSADQPQRL